MKILKILIILYCILWPVTLFSFDIDIKTVESVNIIFDSYLDFFEEKTELKNINRNYQHQLVSILNASELEEEIALYPDLIEGSYLIEIISESSLITVECNSYNQIYYVDEKKFYKNNRVVNILRELLFLELERSIISND